MHSLNVNILNEKCLRFLKKLHVWRKHGSEHLVILFLVICYFIYITMMCVSTVSCYQIVVYKMGVWCRLSRR